MSQILVFVCHNNESIHTLIQNNEHLFYQDRPNIYLFFVGNSPLDPSFADNDNIIIARDLLHNIEFEPRLLTFTAWWAIAKNGLFQEYDSVSIFEYDVILEPDFEKRLNQTCLTTNKKVITFFHASEYFIYDVEEEVMKHFLTLKGIPHDIIPEISKSWWPTTNHCIHKSVLADFVDWYYPDCLKIKELDSKQFSYYHERLFSVYLKVRGVDCEYMKGAKHIQSNSHKDL